MKILINGEKKFESLFKDLEEAKNHIHVEYYMFNDDKIKKLQNLIIYEKKTHQQY